MGEVSLFTWWGVVPLSPEAAAAILIVGWSLAPLWLDGIVVRVAGVRPWYRRRPLARRRSTGNRVRWTPQVTR